LATAYITAYLVRTFGTHPNPTKSGTSDMPKKLAEITYYETY